MIRDVEHALSPQQEEAIIELGSRGSGGSFDQSVLAQLFNLGLIEVRNDDRRLALTKRGRTIYAGLKRR